MPASWEQLDPEVKSQLTHEALRRAVDMIAEQADMLAAEMESGNLADRGGPDALRLLAALVRATDCNLPGQAGMPGQVGHA